MSRTERATQRIEPDERVVIDRRQEADKWRYVCPNGHTSWDRTNSHLWCPACASAADHDDDIDPEHYEVLDKSAEKLIPWDCVKVVS